jgi:hypothetical protein
MNLSNYLIDQDGHDWSEILFDWHWLLPAEFTVWMVNRFGDVIFVSTDGAVHLLDIGVGQVKQLAASREEFIVKVDVDGNADNWLLISLTDKCVESGLTLDRSQCYSHKIAPVFGGEYIVGNIHVIDLAVNFSLLAQIHQQIKDLPDGTQVKFKLGA